MNGRKFDRWLHADDVVTPDLPARRQHQPVTYCGTCGMRVGHWAGCPEASS